MRVVVVVAAMLLCTPFAEVPLTGLDLRWQ